MDSWFWNLLVPRVVEAYLRWAWKEYGPTFKAWHERLNELAILFYILRADALDKLKASEEPQEILEPRTTVSQGFGSVAPKLGTSFTFLSHNWWSGIVPNRIPVTGFAWSGITPKIDRRLRHGTWSFVKPVRFMPENKTVMGSIIAAKPKLGYRPQIGHSVTSGFGMRPVITPPQWRP